MTMDHEVSSEPLYMQRALKVARLAMSDRDASHDFEHARRVLGWARMLIHHEMHDASTESRRRIEMAAIFHDVFDSKYAGDGELDASFNLDGLLKEAGIESAEERVQIANIIGAVSFRKEMATSAPASLLGEEAKEIAIVQDADRLDALGPVGIARAFAYAGHKREPFTATIAHIRSKMPEVMKRLKTQTARMMAVPLWHAIHIFVDQLEQDMVTCDSPQDLMV
jgi:uncharacterized protein